MPKLRIPRQNQPMNLQPKQKYLYLFPIINSLLFLIASCPLISLLSTRIKNVIEYEIAAIIPGTINKSVHNSVKIMINKYDMKVFTKMEKPLNKSSKTGFFSLVKDKK